MNDVSAATSSTFKNERRSESTPIVNGRITPRLDSVEILKEKDTLQDRFSIKKMTGGVRLSLVRKSKKLSGTAGVVGTNEVETDNIVYNDSHNYKNIHLLVDTGALQDNYISVDTANWLRQQGAKAQDCKSVVCSGIKRRSCSRCLGKISFDLMFFNDLTNKEDKIFITAKIANITVDIIVGLPTIRKELLVFKMFSQFWKDEADGTRARVRETLSGLPYIASKTVPSECQPLVLDDRLNFRNCKNAVDDLVTGREVINTIHDLSDLSLRKRKEQLLDFEPDEDRSYDLTDGQPLGERLPWESDSYPEEGHTRSAVPGDNSGPPMPGEPELYGPPTLRDGLKRLVNEFKDLFSSQLRAKPADIPAMTIDVDLPEWESNKKSWVG